MKSTYLLLLACLVLSTFQDDKINKNKAPSAIPEKMEAAYIKERGENKLEIGEIDTPVPEYEQVLIKVDAAPLNPSDLYLIEGKYGEFLDFNYPFVPGFEGSGTVIASGGGILPWYLQGKRVAFTKQDEYMHSGRKLLFGGSIAQYAITSGEQCIVLDDNTSFNQGAVSFLNYLTSVGLVEQVTRDKGTAVLITAAASTVGQLMIKQFNDLGIDVIAVVRTDEQENIIRQRFKVKEVLNQDEDEFEFDLTRSTREFGCKHALESVGGAVMGKIVN
jgi:NADPH:quinone reductase